jgi:uncharacterized protein (TIGR03067 family)
MTTRLLIALWIPVLFVVDASGQDAQKELAGQWKMFMAEVDGKKLSERAIRNTRIKISDDKYAYSRSQWGSFRLIPTERPKAIDMSPAVGANKGKTALGIYQINDDELTICIAKAGKKRPSEFTTKTGSGYILEIYRREKR